MSPQQSSTAQSIGAENPESLEDITVDPEVAEHWELWSRAIGGLALPRLEALRASVPEIRSAMLCTADGMNLCAMGIEPDNVGRMAALNSSQFALASSQAEIVSEGGASRGQTMVNISTGHGHLVLASFIQPPLGQLLLSLSAESLQLGTLIVRARQTTADIQEWLTKAQSEGQTPPLSH
ncbi:MAG: roadblock/LC7 domain-containing protein [Micrococcus sp.]|nr:roadblock/LC7 domain-containing protein [Micrococcus sp.]